MYKITHDRVSRWSTVTQGNRTWKFPVAITCACPGCNIKHGFALAPADHSATNRLNTGGPLGATCPGCMTSIRCYIFGASEGDQDSCEIWIHPAPRSREPLPLDQSAQLPDRLVRDYHAVLDCYASGHWRAATGQARTVLEGLVKYLLTNDEHSKGRRMLGELFGRLSDETDLAKPIRDVGDVLREGGNLANHFDANRDISQELADETIEMLDSFINYLILIPERVTRLKALIEGDAGAME